MSSPTLGAALGSTSSSVRWPSSRQRAARSSPGKALEDAGVAAAGSDDDVLGPDGPPTVLAFVDASHEVRRIKKRADQQTWSDRALLEARISFVRLVAHEHHRVGCRSHRVDVLEWRHEQNRGIPPPPRPGRYSAGTAPSRISASPGSGGKRDAPSGRTAALWPRARAPRAPGFSALSPIRTRTSLPSPAVYASSPCRLALGRRPAAENVGCEEWHQ